MGYDWYDPFIWNPEGPAILQVRFPAPSEHDSVAGFIGAAATVTSARHLI
jgi:hypothetical protein